MFGALPRARTETVGDPAPAALDRPELPPLPTPLPIEEPAAASALDMSEDDTYLLSRDAAATTTPAAAPAWSVPPPAPTREMPSLDEDTTQPGASPAVPAPVQQPTKPAWQSGGSTEVAPPSDLQGPGWAVATTRIPTVPAATPRAPPHA